MSKKSLKTTKSKFKYCENKLSLITKHLSFERFLTKFYLFYLFLAIRGKTATDKHINAIKVSDRSIRCMQIMISVTWVNRKTSQNLSWFCTENQYGTQDTK